MTLVWKSPPWRTEKGYIRGRVVNYPWPRKSGQMYEHIAAMELALGRKLEVWEHVHHRDEDKAHNALENLEVREADEHSRYHCRRQPRTPYGAYATSLPDEPPF